VADTGLGDRVISRVNGASVTGTVTEEVVLWEANTAESTEIKDTFIIAGDSTNAKTLIVDFVPGTLSADTVDRVIVSDAATLSIV
jgi:hypothetical protein